jgi:hypothetical protein
LNDVAGGAGAFAQVEEDGPAPGTGRDYLAMGLIQEQIDERADVRDNARLKAAGGAAHRENRHSPSGCAGTPAGGGR